MSKSDLISSKRPPACILDLVDVEKLEMLPNPGAPIPTLPDAEWPVGWEAHERDPLERTARLSLSSKLEWLEEAQELAEHLRRNRVQPAAEK